MFLFSSPTKKFAAYVQLIVANFLVRIQPFFGSIYVYIYCIHCTVDSYSLLDFLFLGGSWKKEILYTNFKCCSATLMNPIEYDIPRRSVNFIQNFFKRKFCNKDIFTKSTYSRFVLNTSVPIVVKSDLIPSNLKTCWFSPAEENRHLKYFQLCEFKILHNPSSTTRNCYKKHKCYYIKRNSFWQ